MAKRLKRLVHAGLLVTLCSLLASCEPPQVYGSIGYSSYSGGYHGSGFGTSVRIGGRIY